MTLSSISIVVVVLLVASVVAEYRSEDFVYETYNPERPGYFYKGASSRGFSSFSSGNGANSYNTHLGPIVPGLKIDAISANGKVIQEIGGEDNGLPAFIGFGENSNIDLGGPTVPSFKIISITALPKAPNFPGYRQMPSNAGNVYLPPSNIGSGYLPPSSFRRFTRQPQSDNFGSPKIAVSMDPSDCYYLQEGGAEFVAC